MSRDWSTDLVDSVRGRGSHMNPARTVQGTRSASGTKVDGTFIVYLRRVNVPTGMHGMETPSRGHSLHLPDSPPPSLLPGVRPHLDPRRPDCVTSYRPSLPTSILPLHFHPHNASSPFHRVIGPILHSYDFTRHHGQASVQPTAVPVGHVPGLGRQMVPAQCDAAELAAGPAAAQPVVSVFFQRIGRLEEQRMPGNMQCTATHVAGRCWRRATSATAQRCRRLLCLLTLQWPTTNGIRPTGLRTATAVWRRLFAIATGVRATE